MRSNRVKSLPWIAAVVIALVPAIAADVRAATEARESAWVPRYDWSLEVDGKPSDEAYFFVEVEGRRILVQAPQLPKAAILNPSGQKVTELDRSSVTIDGEGDSAQLTPAAESKAPTGTYTVDGGRVLFYLGDNRLKISPKEPLEGETTRDEILRHSPLYRKGITDYKPEPGEIAAIRSYAQPIVIDVVFGTWCPHCKVLVPKFMKALDEAGNTRIRVNYTGVPKNFGTYPPAMARRVTGIPTFIFYRNGVEFGRIPGEPTKGTIEHAVAEILREAQSK